jgi:phosphoglucosamine mutase
MAEQAARPPTGSGVGGVEHLADALDRYVAHLLSAIEQPLKGLRVVLDLAHGAAYEAAPRAFREAGAEVHVVHGEPDGNRINVDCGSTSLGDISKAVVRHGADLGLAFDGDADRVLAVDEAGAEVDGDRIVGAIALRMHETGELKNDIVVTTVMANLGFRRALEQRGIEIIAAPVGDKHVVDAMTDSGAVLGGEQSGHVVFSEHSSTGDGILTGLKLAEVLALANEPLSKIAHFFEPYPQVLINVPVGSKDSLDTTTAIWTEVDAAEARLGAEGRVLVRASGTEPLVRVMVEAADEATASEVAEHLVKTVQNALPEQPKQG